MSRTSTPQRSLPTTIPPLSLLIHCMEKNQSVDKMKVNTFSIHFNNNNIILQKIIQSHPKVVYSEDHICHRSKEKEVLQS